VPKVVGEIVVVFQHQKNLLFLIKMEQIEKSFGDCTLSYLEDSFGLRPINDCTHLDKWLNEQCEINSIEQDELTLLQALLRHNVLHWNEQELSLHFIGPIFSLARFISLDLKYNLFAERTIEAVVHNHVNEPIRLFGKPDGLIATGYREPKTPFFAFQEYKKHKEPNGEPEGQCLSALLAGQSINQNLYQPMYGCIVAGQNWYFLTLVDKEYCISPAYSALTTEIFFIFKALKNLKAVVIELSK
jgi:hypothetical protein